MVVENENHTKLIMLDIEGKHKKIEAVVQRCSVKKLFLEIS